MRLCKHRKNVFYCFYKITLKTTTRENIKKIILLIKTYLATTPIWHWHFSTDQSKLTFENPVIGDVACLQLVYLYVTQPCFAYSHASTPLGQSERAYYLSYFIKNDIGQSLWTSKFHLHMLCAFLSDVIWQERLDLKLLWESVALKVRFFKWRFKQQSVHQYFVEEMGGSVYLQTRSVIGERDIRLYNTNT